MLSDRRQRQGQKAFLDNKKGNLQIFWFLFLIFIVFPIVAADYYEILGVKKYASQEDIKKAYRKLSLLLHPDRTGHDEEKTVQFKEVKDAYDVLGYPEKRKLYDRYGAIQSTA